MIEGPETFAGRFAQTPAALPPTAPQATGQQHKATVAFADQMLELATDGRAISRVTEFDSMERFATDSGVGHFISLKARTDKPYPLTMNVSKAVAELNHHGQCLRVHDHHQKKPGTHVDAGILVHKAPTIGWLIGCIAPRLKGHRILSHNRDPSRRAMDFIFDAMGGFKAGRKASLLVLDW